MLDLVVGSTAAIASRAGILPTSPFQYRIVTITKVTPKYFWVGTAQYSRETGKAHNQDASGTLVLVTDEITQDISDKIEAKRLARERHQASAHYCVGLFQKEWNISEADSPNELDGLGYDEIVGPFIGFDTAKAEADRRNTEILNTY